MANEKQLIDAKALAENVYALTLYVTGLRNGKTILKERMEKYRNAVLREICKAPTVDAVEVVHGRWEDMWDGKYANPRYRCSVCKEKANYKSVQDELLSWHDVQVLTPYCPYCMAKLDGGIDNDIKTV